MLTTIATLTTLAPQAMAAPMPWETSKTPPATLHHAKATTTHSGDTLTVLCTGGCYQ